MMKCAEMKEDLCEEEEGDFHGLMDGDDERDYSKLSAPKIYGKNG